MGCFDTVHDGYRHGQTKALGKGLDDLAVGDAAALFPVWGPWEAPDDDGQRPVTFAAEVAFTDPSGGDGWVLVRDGHVAGLYADAPAGVPLFDYLGHELDRPRRRTPAPAAPAPLSPNQAVLAALAATLAPDDEPSVLAAVQAAIDEDGDSDPVEGCDVCERARRLGRPAGGAQK